MTCCRKVSTAGKPKPKTKTAPRGVPFIAERSRLFARGLHELRVGHDLARLEDGDRLELAALHREDRDLRVLAIALLIEGDRTRRASERDLLQLGQILFGIGRVRLLHRVDEKIRRI